MDTWKFFDITHRDHVVCNPVTVTKLDELIGYLDLPAPARVLDIACGKGELLLRVGERWAAPAGSGLHAVAVDLSPFCIADLRAAAAARLPEADVEMLLMDGAAYRAEPASFDLACCLGASWTFGGHPATLRYLAAAVRPGGLVLVGEPFWRAAPDPEYLAANGLSREDFGSHAGNVEAAVEEGLIPLLALVSSGDEWDRYESLQWRAAARWATANQDDSDVPEVIGRVERERRAYLRWGRECLGWALYLFERPG